MVNGSLNETEQAYAQARAYGKDLARLYATEKMRRQEFETTSQKLRTIFNTVPTGLAVVDRNLVLLEANPRFLALFEQTPGCIGQPLTGLLPTQALLDTMHSLEAQSARLGTVEVKIEEPFCRTLLITLAPLDSRHDWVLVFHDLTERNRLEGLKNEFINIAAHELRTPLAGIVGFATLLQENVRSSDADAVGELTSLIVQSAQRLKGIIDELVNFAATQREVDSDLHIVEVDLHSLMQKSFKVLQHRIEARGLICQIELPDEPLLLRADQLILSEVIYHLLNNAVNFNKPEGKIIIRAQQFPVFASSAKQLSKTTVIEIEDTGIGIPQVDLDRVFDKFYQVEEHLTRSIGGLGLGLTIARHGVQRHGGQLTVRSQLGQGSVFRIVLPSIINANDTSIDNRADVAHQQTLVYARDMARALVTKRQMSNRLEQIKALSARLEEQLGHLPEDEAGLELAETLRQAQTLAGELKKLASL